MGKTCCGPDEAGANNNDPTWRRILWIALGLNAIMFGVEIVAGIAADSRALQADAGPDARNTSSRLITDCLTTRQVPS